MPEPGLDPTASRATSSRPDQTASPRPVAAGERVGSLDLLRGVAVLGILALNIQSYAMPGSAYMNPTAYGDFEGINYWVWYVSHLLGDMKFWSIFSMLFGASVLIQTSRCEATGRSAIGVHYRRMAWLLVFGLAHAHLIWYGDILYAYAMCGLVLYWLRNRKPTTLILLGLASLLVAFAGSLGFGWLLNSGEVPEMRDELSEAWRPNAQLIENELEIYRGSWIEQFEDRSTRAIFFETFLFSINFGWRSLGLMLLGMALYKLGVLSASRSRTFYWVLVLIAVGGGLPLVAYGVQQNEVRGWTIDYSFYYGPLYNYGGSILVALGWVGVVMLIWKTPALRSLCRPFSAAGRMALTGYLLQSLLVTFVFYGHGLGRFGHLERWEQMLIVVAVWGFLLVFAPLWLRFFRYGPFEWLWRTLTYARLQPMKVDRDDRS